MKHRTGWSPEDQNEQRTEADEGGPAGTADGDYRDDERSTVEVIQTLFTSGREYAEAETRRQKVRISIAASAIRMAALLFGAALFLLLGVLVALPIGAIWVLAPHIGPIPATLVVFVSGILVVMLLVQLARAKLRRIFRRIMSKGDAG